jgi:hypothetical protein
MHHAMFSPLTPSPAPSMERSSSSPRRLYLDDGLRIGLARIIFRSVGLDATFTGLDAPIVENGNGAWFNVGDPNPELAFPLGMEIGTGPLEEPGVRGLW